MPSCHPLLALQGVHVEADVEADGSVAPAVSWIDFVALLWWAGFVVPCEAVAQQNHQRSLHAVVLCLPLCHLVLPAEAVE